MQIKFAKKKPITVEAVELKMSNVLEVAAWCHGRIEDFNIKMDTPSGEQIAVCGRDHIIKGVDGEFYPIPNKTFQKSYDVEPQDRGPERGTDAPQEGSMKESFEKAVEAASLAMLGRPILSATTVRAALRAAIPHLTAQDVPHLNGGAEQ